MRGAARHACRARRRTAPALCRGTPSRTDTRRHMPCTLSSRSRRAAHTHVPDAGRGKRTRPTALPHASVRIGECAATSQRESGRSARASPPSGRWTGDRRAPRSHRESGPCSCSRRRPVAVARRDRRGHARAPDHLPSARRSRPDGSSRSAQPTSAPAPSARRKSCATQPPGKRRSTGVIAARPAGVERVGGQRTACSRPRSA